MSKKDATVISAVSSKGGVSKTSFCYHWGYYTVYYHHAKVLFVDLDSQANLTSMFNLSPNTIREHTIFNAFKHDADNPQGKWNLTPVHVDNNVDVLPAVPKLATTSKVMRDKASMQSYVLLHYFLAMHFKSKYDYIIIDCHNNFLLNTINALVNSDFSIVPVNASAFSIQGIKGVLRSINTAKSKVVSPLNNQSFITTKVKMIASMIPKNTKTGHQLLQAIKNDNYFISHTYHHELFNRANLKHCSVFKLAKDSGKRNDIKTVNNEIIPEFNQVYKVIQGE